MTDTALFSSGSLFTREYLEDGISSSKQYAAVDASALLERLQALLGAFPHRTRPNEATTENDLVWPVLELLGWSHWLTQQNLSGSGRENVPDGLLFIDAAAKASANDHPEEWRRYEFGATILESKRWGRPLDRAEGRSGSERETPSTQLLRYLRRIDDLTSGRLRWGILTNGAKWRLYYAGARSTIDDYLEIDLSRILGLENDLLDTGVTDEDRRHWLKVFGAMFSRTAFEREAQGAPSFHDRARREAAFYEEHVAKSLSDLVFNDLYPTLGKAIAAAAPRDTDLAEIRHATLILLYRLLFILYAEDRGLLPVKDRRYDDYALRFVREDVGRRKDEGDAFSRVATAIWNRFASLAVMIDRGDPSVGLPPYNGGLFSAAHTPLLTAVALADDVMADAIDILSFERRDGQRRYINYRDLSVQQLGSIYERLLEFEMKRGEDGEMEILPNIFARKDSGSYYTPDELVLLIIDETLEPLIEDAFRGFTDAIGQLKAGDSHDYQLRVLEAADPAKAITRLRVCDPAMGSGHFLVSLVDRLTNHALDAMARAAEIAAEAGIEGYESPIAAEIRSVRDKIWVNARQQNWAIAEEQLDDPQLVKRMVLKRCVHGVDKNPMAVELAKVALWLHTFTVGAPLSFIDHHLHAGDSLFGLWVRDAIDKAGEGAALFLHEPLQRAQTQARVMENIEALTDAEIAEAHQSAELWEGIEAQIGELDTFVKFMHAIDWLNVKDRREQAAIRGLLTGQYGDPIAIMRGRAQPFARATPFQASGGTDRLRRQQFESGELLDSLTELLSRTRELMLEERFLNWQIAFPGVWKDWASAERKGGFDAVIGNPPWDRIKLQQVEWFAARRPEIAKTQRASDRKRMIQALKRAEDPLYIAFEKAEGRASDTSRVARDGGHFPLLGRGDLNLYSLFVERAHALVKPTGMVGLLTPSGIAGDLSAAEFFRGLSTHGRVKSLFDFENRRTRYELEPFFPDVDSRFKFTAMIASPARKFAETTCGFFLQAVTEIDNPERVFSLAAGDFSQVNPNTGTAPVFRSRRDMELTIAVYGRCPVFIDRSSGKAVATWPIRFATMFHMTNDSGLFRTRDELEEQEGAWHLAGNRLQSSAGEWVPLYEGKMVQAFDHRAASVVVNADNLNRPAQPVAAGADQSADPSWVPEPQYWVARSSCPPTDEHGWYLGFKEITAPTNARTFIAAAFPQYGFGNKVPLLLRTVDNAPLELLLANFNSVPFDFVTRTKVQGQTLNLFIVEQLPVLPPRAYERRFGPKTAAEIVREAVLELTYTAHDMAPFAKDMGYVDEMGEALQPFMWNEDRRLRLRAKLDAIYLILYGIYDPERATDSRNDIRYIYSTFPIVERQEVERWGSYRTRDLALAWINALEAGEADATIS